MFVSIVLKGTFVILCKHQVGKVVSALRLSLFLDGAWHKSSIVLRISNILSVSKCLARGIYLFLVISFRWTLAYLSPLQVDIIDVITPQTVLESIPVFFLFPT